MPKKKIADPTAPPRRSTRLNRVIHSPSPNPSLTSSELSEPPAATPKDTDAVDELELDAATPKDTDAVDELELDAAEKEHQAALAAKEAAKEAKAARKAAKDAAGNKKTAANKKTATNNFSGNDIESYIKGPDWKASGSGGTQREISMPLSVRSDDRFSLSDMLNDKPAAPPAKRKIINISESESENEGGDNANLSASDLLKPKPAKKVKIGKDRIAKGKVNAGTVQLQDLLLSSTANQSTLSLDEVHNIIVNINNAAALLEGSNELVVGKPEDIYDLFVGKGVRLPTFPRLLVPSLIKHTFNVTDESDVTDDQLTLTFGHAVLDTPILYPPYKRGGTFVNDSVSSIWQAICDMSVLYVQYEVPCSYCERASNTACFYDVRLGSKSCARCIRSHRDCSLKVQPPRAQAQAAAHLLEGAARAGNANPNWVQSLANQINNNRT